MVTKKDFPEKVYLWVEEDMDGKYLLAEKCVVDCLHEFNQKTLIGIYKLEMVKKYIKGETI